MIDHRDIFVTEIINRKIGKKKKKEEAPASFPTISTSVSTINFN